MASNLKEQAQRWALEMLEQAEPGAAFDGASHEEALEIGAEVKRLAEVLRAALAQPAAGGPVAWMKFDGSRVLTSDVKEKAEQRTLEGKEECAFYNIPLYTAAPVAAGEPVATASVTETACRNCFRDADGIAKCLSYDCNVYERPVTAPPAAAHGAIPADVLAPFLAVVDVYDPAEDDAYVPAKDWMMDGALRLTLGQFRALKRAAAHGDEAVRKDAERYRLLRRGQRWSVINGIGDTLRADTLDAAIDAAMRAQTGEGGE